MSKPKARKWELINDLLTPNGVANIPVGQVLTFDYEGSRTSLRVMRKAGGKVWAKEVQLYSPDELNDETLSQIEELERANGNN